MPKETGLISWKRLEHASGMAGSRPLAYFGSASAPFSGIPWRGDGCCSCSLMFTPSQPQIQQNRERPLSNMTKVSDLFLAQIGSPAYLLPITVARGVAGADCRSGPTTVTKDRCLQNTWLREGEGGSLTEIQGIVRKEKWMPENHSYPL